jgi:hypothetical protein
VLIHLWLRSNGVMRAEIQLYSKLKIEIKTAPSEAGFLPELLHYRLDVFSLFFILACFYMGFESLI